MAEQKDTIYTFASLANYTFKQRVLIRVAAFAFFAFIRILGSTLRFEIEGGERLEAVRATGKLPVYAFWHDRIFYFTASFRDRGIVVMTSRSFDGEYIARFIQRFGFGAIRGSSSRGGSRALVEMIKAMRAGHEMAFTIDGPRGPRHVVKPGPVMLARKTGNPIVAGSAAARSYWTINSWDRLQIPKPFSKVVVVVGEPIYVDESAGETDLESAISRMQKTLDDTTVQAEEWYKRK